MNHENRKGEDCLPESFRLSAHASSGSKEARSLSAGAFSARNPATSSRKTITISFRADDCMPVSPFTSLSESDSVTTTGGGISFISVVPVICLNLSLGCTLLPNGFVPPRMPRSSTIRLPASDPRASSSRYSSQLSRGGDGPTASTAASASCLHHQEHMSGRKASLVQFLRPTVRPILSPVKLPMDFFCRPLRNIAETVKMLSRY